MSHFYGRLQGTKGVATRCGDKSNGLVTEAMGWAGVVLTSVWHDDGQDRYRVVLRSHPAGYGGREITLAEGVLDHKMALDQAAFERKEKSDEDRGR